MLTPQIMKMMDTGHLVASARAEIDPLTSTPLELELLDRLETMLDEQSANQPLVDLLNDQDIREPDQLEELLDLANNFRALAPDVGDLLTRLNDLVSTTKE